MAQVHLKTAETYQSIARVLWLTLGFNVAVALGKVLLGIATGALAITADGFHSLTDGAGNITGLVANRYACQPPDEDHPYGHGRFASLGALMIGALLLLTAWEVGKGALDRLSTPVPPDITPLTFGVLAVTLGVNIFVSRYQIQQGNRLNSEILLADSKNTSADVFVTLSVIMSSALVAFTGLAWIDTLSAVIVMGLVGRSAFSILNQTGRVLVDTAPYESHVIREALSEVPHVRAVQRVRSRGTADSAYIDVDVSVAPHTTVGETHLIAEQIRDTLYQRLDGAIEEIEVHFVPEGILESA